MHKGPPYGMVASWGYTSVSGASRECPCPGDVRVPRGQPRDITITRKSSLGISLSLETPLGIIPVFLDSMPPTSSTSLKLQTRRMVRANPLHCRNVTFVTAKPQGTRHRSHRSRVCHAPPGVSRLPALAARLPARSEPQLVRLREPKPKPESRGKTRG